MSDLILDSLRGELSPAEAAKLDARLASDSGLRAESDRLRGFLAREQQAQSSALSAVLDSGAADRMASRILDRARRSESRRAPAPGRRSLWVRLLAVSIAAHVLALAFFSWRHFHPATSRPSADGHDWAMTSSDAPEDRLPRDSESDMEPTDLPLPGAYDVPTIASGDASTLPIEDMLSLPAPLTPVDKNAFSRSNGRGMWLRTNESMKGMIEARLGTPDSLSRVKTGLSALARVQASDGSFADASGQASVRVTATVVLAFAGDGHSSNGGAHRAVVDRAVAWLAKHTPAASDAPAIDRSLSLFAQSEDLILSSGGMTPAESAMRREALVPLAKSVRDSYAAAGTSSTTEAAAVTTDARWSELSLEAAARSGVGGFPAVTIAAIIDVAAIRPTGDVRTAMLNGSVLLKDRRMQKDQRSTTFTEWNAATSRLLASRLGVDGLVAGSDPAARRAEETALILLAFEVAYRTY